jgi:hypothetical protein
MTNLLFSRFEITTENKSITKKAFDSKFYNVEDAIQYFSALEAKADIIITKNAFDFINPSIEVVHPFLFAEYYL